MPNLIITTVGTSLLTNGASAEERKALTVSANLPRLSAEDEALVLRRAEAARTALADSLAAARKASAEVNGLEAIRLANPTSPRDHHWLIATPTRQCRATAELVSDYLKQHWKPQSVEVIAPDKLTTDNTRNFEIGLSALLKELWDRDIEALRRSGYRVIFHLTGGFKGLQGCLSAAGMFLADEVVYLFQSGDELIRIPRLPVQIDAGARKTFDANPGLFLRASEGGVATTEFADVPDSFVAHLDANVSCLSLWGELIWKQAREDVLSEHRLPSLPMLEYSDRFRSEVEAWQDKRQVAELHQRLARVSAALVDNAGSAACDGNCPR